MTEVTSSDNKKRQEELEALKDDLEAAAVLTAFVIARSKQSQSQASNFRNFLYSLFREKYGNMTYGELRASNFNKE